MSHAVARTPTSVSRGTLGASPGRDPERPLTSGNWYSRRVVGRVARVPWGPSSGSQRPADVATPMRSVVGHMADRSWSRAGGPRPRAPECGSRISESAEGRAHSPHQEARGMVNPELRVELLGDLVLAPLG